MDDDRYERIKAAMEKYHTKDLREINRLQGRAKKNAKPEKEVEAACMKWMRSQGWDVDIYEAKNVRDGKGNFYASNMPAGVVDCMGITPFGEPVYVEFKAPGSRHTINYNAKQERFLKKKIRFLAFGCVVDSQDRLEKTYKKWGYIRFNDGETAARDYLLDQLPKKRPRD